MIVVVYICELSLCADGAAKQIPLLSCQLVAWIHVSHVVSTIQIPLLSCQLVAWIHVSHVVFYNSLLKAPNQCLDYKPTQYLHTMV